MKPTPDDAPLHSEVEALRRRLEEAEETIEAIRSGAVDAFVIGGADGERIYTLQTADRPYRVLVETMQQGALTLNADGVVLYCNPRLSALLARPRERLTGDLFSSLVPAAAQAAIAALLQRAARDGAAEAETTLLRADGHEVPVLINASPLPHEAGAAICVLVSDLTERRHYDELQRAQAALREADRRKDEFLATLAHELRNPLAPIRNAVQLLQLGGERDARQARAREIIERQLAQMVRLIDDLLDVSRITLDRLELHRERVGLAAVLAQAIEACQPSLERAGHTLTVALPDQPVLLDADAARLAQVFGNLLNNACKYTPSGGRIALRAGWHDGDATAPAHAWVEVEDDGIGLPGEFLPRLFEKFAQVEPALHRSQGGLGIGLALARRLTEMHGGSISAYSEGPGRGSRFVVRLPGRLDAASAAATSPAAPTPAGAAERRRILVVDDNHDSADSLATLLELGGDDVRTAYDGFEALAAAEQWRPDVVLLDIGMPKFNGYEVCRRIRSEPWGAQTVLIAQTGWGQDGDRQRAEAEGFDAHLVKPAEPGQLDGLMQTLLALRRQPAPSGTPSA